jgi:O-antigen/teichoic acid export membrane protein
VPLLKDVTYSFLWRGLTVVINILIGILLARYLGVDDRGAYAVVILTLTLLCLLVNFGIPDATVFLLGQKKMAIEELAISGFVYNLVVGIAISLLAYCLLFYDQNSIVFSTASRSAYTIVLIAVIPQSLTTFITLFLLGLKKVIQYNKLMTFMIVTQLFCLLGAVFFSSFELENAVKAYVLACFINLLLAFYYFAGCLKSFSLIHIKKEAITAGLKYGKPFFATGLGGFALQRMNYKWLEYTHNSAAVGLYAVASSLPNFVGIIPAQLATVLYSWISNAESDEERHKIVTTVFKIAFWSCLLISALIVCFIKPIILLLYGQAYLAASIPAIILLFAAIGTGLSGVFINYLSGIGQPKYGAYLTILDIVLLFIIGYIVIPNFGVEGAAFSSLLTNLIALIYIGFVFLRQSKLPWSSLFRLDETERQKIKLMWTDALKKLRSTNRA